MDPFFEVLLSELRKNLLPKVASLGSLSLDV